MMSEKSKDLKGGFQYQERHFSATQRSFNDENRKVEILN